MKIELVNNKLILKKFNPIKRDYEKIKMKISHETKKKIIREEKITTIKVEIEVNEKITNISNRKQNDIMWLLEVYEPELFHHYSNRNPLCGLTQNWNKEEEYMGGCASIKDIENNPEAYNQSYDQEIWHNIAYWRVI